MCTFNKMVFGEQVTVQFYVDDLKVSHQDQAVLDDFLDELRSEFRQEDELTENKGLVHKYLGITINYSIPGKVVFTLFNYLEDVIIEAAKDLTIINAIHQDCHQKTRNYCIVMLQDYYLQARGQGPTYKYVLHFYAHE